MKTYCVAVAFRPSIFRPLVARLGDLANRYIYIDVIILMIKKCDILFDKDISAEELIMMPEMYLDGDMSLDNYSQPILDQLSSNYAEEEHE